MWLGSVNISVKNKQAISIEFHNPKDNQTTAKLLMKLLSEEIAKQIYNKRNDYTNADGLEKKGEGRNLS